VTRFQIQSLIVLIFTIFGASLGWYLGSKRVRRRSIFGNDYVGSPSHRRIMARRQLIRLLTTFLYGLGGTIVGVVFLMATRRR
jgi:hypothetical protein